MNQTRSATCWIAILLASASVACSKGCGSATTTGSTNAAPVATLSADQKRQAYDSAVGNLRDRRARMQTLIGAFASEDVDVQALGRSLKTPEAAFAYVRDGIALEPYVGVMKGSLGALVSRGGNAVDRSVLLVALLAQNGIQSKVAHGTLSDRDANTLHQQIGSRPGALEHISRVLPTSLPAAQISDDEKKSVDAINAQAEARGNTRRTEADAGAAVLRASLAGPGGAAAPNWSAVQLAALKDHFWVQASVGGHTVDFDPAFADAQAGQRFAEPTETFGPDRLPEALYHRVEIRVVADVLESGHVARKELVDAEARAVDLFDQNIRITILPQAIAVAQNTYQASVTLGHAAPVAKFFTIRPAAGGATPQKPLGGAAAGVLDAFGGGEPEQPEKKNETQGVLGRLAVEIVAKAPVMGDATYRRVIMDRLVENERVPRLQTELQDDDRVRSLLLQVWDGTISVGASHPLLMLRHQLETLTKQQSMMERSLAATYLGQPMESTQLAEWQLPRQIVEFFFQSALAHHLVAAREAPTVRLYHLRPQLAFSRHGVGVDDWSTWNESRRFQNAIDLVNLPYAFVGTAADSAKMSLELGVADTTLERALARDGSDFNTIPLVAAALQQKIALLTVRPTQMSIVQEFQIPAPLRAVLLDELRRGRTLVVPAGLVTMNQVSTFGWWSVDPESGAPLGQMDLGAGQGAVESAKLTEATATMSHTIGKLYAGIVGCFYSEAGRQLGAQGGRSFAIPGTASIHPDEPLGECIAAKVCEATIEYAFLAGGVASFHHRNWYQEIGWMGLHMFGPAIMSHFSCH